MSSSETYGTTFVVVGSKTTVAPPVRNLPKRTPSRLDNARRWAPTSYSKNHAEQHRRVQTSQFSNENFQNEKKLASLRLEQPLSKVDEPISVPERALPPPPRSSSGSPAPPPPPADYNNTAVSKSSSPAEPFYI